MDKLATFTLPANPVPETAPDHPEAIPESPLSDPQGPPAPGTCACPVCIKLRRPGNWSRDMARAYSQGAEDGKTGKRGVLVSLDEMISGWVDLYKDGPTGPEALAVAASVFTAYADHHERGGHPEKAARNRALANIMYRGLEAALEDSKALAAFRQRADETEALTEPK